MQGDVNGLATLPGTMRWDGWGEAGRMFDPGDRPYIWPYVARHLDITPDWPRTPAVDAAALRPPAGRLTPALRAGLAEILPADRWSEADMDRILRAYGKSTRDLWRLRHGRIDYAPDAVVVPVTEEETAAVIALAGRLGAVIIPFGGGSNVAGCLESVAPDGRPVISADLRAMNRVLAVDTVSGLARVQPGILGPDLEAALNEVGMTLGHFPDSFPFSTLGGWVATRSSGMMSDAYGNIEDMVVALRMVTPTGLIATRAVPHASNGPDANRLCIGSEGGLGIITELTMRIRPLPAHREFRGYLFPTFADGLAALKDCAQAGVSPILSRLNDPGKTQLSAAFRPRDSAGKHLLGKLFKAWLKKGRGFDMEQACLLVAAYQGDAAQVRRGRAAAEGIYHRHGAARLGRGPGESFAAGKYDFPYIRDFLLARGVICDVAETSTSWGGMADLYGRGMSEISRALRRDGRPAWLGCHVSHTYPAGASVYFSYAFRCAVDQNGRYDPQAELAYYAAVKKASLECFAAVGATLSHHHAVGYEHLPWLVDESHVGDDTLMDRVKTTFDPQAVMNPERLRGGFGTADLDALLPPRSPDVARRKQV